MTDEAKALVERMGLTLGEWLVDEAPNDWWEYQRDHMKARDLIEELDRNLTLSGKVSKALSEHIETLETQLESANEALRERLDICETQAREIERLTTILSAMNDTDVIARTMAENKRLRGLVRGWHYLAVGPDEMGDYYTQKALIKASEPYASPALKALAGDSHDQ